MSDVRAARLPALDLIRGVAVLGIVAMNIVSIALPSAAYLNPAALGAPSDADITAWATGFVLVDGKMRALFSMLFGASLLLVVDGAEARGESGAGLHLRRMAWLLLFGLLHFFLVWRGDILVTYAVAGAVALPFRRWPVERMLGVAVLLVAFQLALWLTAAWLRPGLLAGALNPYPPGGAEQIVAVYRGSFAGLVHYRLTHQLFGPAESAAALIAETLGYMLIGMAALRSGLFAGAWAPRKVRLIASWGIGLGLIGYGLLAVMQWESGFDPVTLFGAGVAAPVLLRPVMALGYAAALILLARRGGVLVGPIAAAGRAAFTNYLGIDILLAFVFQGWGLGLFGSAGRAELWLFTLGAWALMLLWPAPWLARFRHGPFEWLWRSLAHGRRQPLRVQPPTRLA